LQGIVQIAPWLPKPAGAGEAATVLAPAAKHRVQNVFKAGVARKVLSIEAKATVGATLAAGFDVLPEIVVFSPLGGVLEYLIGFTGPLELGLGVLFGADIRMKLAGEFFERALDLFLRGSGFKSQYFIVVSKFHVLSLSQVGVSKQASGWLRM
jgi:hypothetical protein